MADKQEIDRKKTVVHKYLFGSPSYFVGSSKGNATFMEVAFSRDFTRGGGSHFIFRFETTEDVNIKMGTVYLEYSTSCEMVSQILTVLFGKLIIPLGFTESDGYRVPNSMPSKKFDKTLTFYSDEVRPEFPILLHLGVLGEVELLKVDSSFINAVGFYQKALLEFPESPGVAYIDLVGAGEILTSRYKGAQLDFFGEEMEKVFKLLASSGEDGLEAINFLKAQSKIKKKYVEGLSKVKDSPIFKDESVHGRLTPDNLISAVSSSYDLRSKYLHEGLSIGAHVEKGFFEVGLSHRLHHSEAIKNLLAKSPSFVCLERIIRQALLMSLFEILERPLITPTEDNSFSF